MMVIVIATCLVSICVLSCETPLKHDYGKNLLHYSIFSKGLLIP